MKHLTILLIMVIFLFPVAASAGVKSFGLKTNAEFKYHRTMATNVTVLDAPPTQKYIKIGDVSARGSSGTNSEKLIKALINEAAKLGATSIMDITYFYQPGAGRKCIPRSHRRAAVADPKYLGCELLSVTATAIVLE